MKRGISVVTDPEEEHLHMQLVHMTYLLAGEWFISTITVTGKFLLSTCQLRTYSV
jgi:hypothetical protein